MQSATEFVTVTCYQRAGINEPCEVEVNKAYVVACERAFQGGEHYQWILTVSTGQQYCISSDDHAALFPRTTSALA
jgi:hypothetical protein